jgi:TetR/AcrR family transcriptional regulator, cholesterol catabolism regulator
MEISEKILLGTKDLFFRYGIKSITMDDIARHLAISKKTIYQHFTDKSELVDKLTDHILQDNICHIKNIREEFDNPIAEIMETMKFMGSTFSKMNPNLFHDMMRYHPDSWNKFKVFKEDCLLRMIESNLTRGIKDGLYREGINTKVLSRLRAEQVELAWRSDIFPPEKFSHVEVQQQMLLHFLYGVCTLKGHKLINKYQQLHEEE